MDLRGKDDPAQAPVGTEASLANGPSVAVPRVAGLGIVDLLRVRDRVRVELHWQLDDLLGSLAQMEAVRDRLGGTVLDELVLDTLNGLGMSVSVETQRPEGKAEKPGIEVVR